MDSIRLRTTKTIVVEEVPRKTQKGAEIWEIFLVNKQPKTKAHYERVNLKN